LTRTPPGDGRNFYQVPEGAAHASQLIIRDVDNVFLPSPSDLLANLGNCREQVVNMLFNLPEHFSSSQEMDNGLSQAASPPPARQGGRQGGHRRRSERGGGAAQPEH